MQVTALTTHITVEHAVYTLYRHPEPESRPEFPDIQVELQRPDFKLLTWRAEDVAAYTEQARTLGAPLEAGEELYTDIQMLYTCI